MITSLFCFWAALALTTAIDTISPSTTRTKTIQQRFNHSWKAPTIFPPSRSTLSWSFCAVLLSNWVLVRNKSCMKLKIFTLYWGVLASLCCSFSKMLGSTSGAVPLFKSCRNYTTFATFCTLVPVITRCNVQAQSRIFCTIFANESLHSSFLNRWPIMRMETLIALCNDLPFKISLLGTNQAIIIITKMSIQIQ